MPKIFIIQGHPDAGHRHFGHALAEAYRKGAEAKGHEVRLVEVASLDFPLLRDPADFQNAEAPEPLGEAQQNLLWADHLVIFYPLWLGTMPALLKAFLEQIFRPGVTLDPASPWKRPLKGRTARVVMTMGMPAFFYRWYFRAHSLKSLERNVLGFCGIKPLGESIIGSVEANDKGRRRWLARMEKLGSRAG